jgi:predicted transposase YbfD/YdcC
MAARRLRTLMAHFEALQDPRVERTRKHQLLDVIAIALCAVIGGADSWTDVEDYGKAKQDWLKGFLALPHGVPSHDTFGRVFAALDPGQFRDCFAAWVAAVTQRLGLKQVAIDGKTLRGSHDRANGLAALHLVSAWATAAHLTLGQVAVDDKSNEITAIPLLLELLDLQGALVTIDALGCQTAIAEDIRVYGGDYLLAVKENQPRLYADIDRLAEAVLAEDAGSKSCLAEDAGHGRQEARVCWVVHDLDDIRDRDRWLDLKSIVILVSERVVGGEATYERRYFISSRRASAKTFLNAVREHWGIENSLHWVLDVCFDEDRSRLRNDHGPENLALLRRLAVSILKQAESGKGSVRRKRLTAGWDNDFLERALLDFTEN